MGTDHFCYQLFIVVRPQSEEGGAHCGGDLRFFGDQHVYA